MFQNHNLSFQISIQSVFYGRQSKENSFCLEKETVQVEDCSVQTALGVIEKNCQGKTECSIQVLPLHLQGENEACLSMRYAS